MLIGAGLGLLFLSAAWHKFRDVTFVHVLADYQLLPTFAVAPVARLLPFFEVVLGVLLIMGLARPATALVAAATLATYALAMAVNLLRSRRFISCGCGLRGSGEQLSWALVVRNGVLVMLVLLLALPDAARVLNWVDVVTLVVGLPAASTLYLATQQLLGNREHVDNWLEMAAEGTNNA